MKVIPLSEGIIIAWVAWFVDIPEQTKVTRYSSLERDFSELPNDGALAITFFLNAKKPDGFCKRIVWKGYDWWFRAKGINDFIYGCDVDCRERNIKEDINNRYKETVIIRGAFTDYATLLEVSEEQKGSQWQL